MSTATLQLSLDLPRDPRDLSDLAGPPQAEARVRRRLREDLAEAEYQSAECSCGGPATRADDGDVLICIACAKPAREATR